MAAIIPTAATRSPSGSLQSPSPRGGRGARAGREYAVPEAAVAVPTAARALRLTPSTQQRNVTAASAALTGAVAEAITSAREAGLSYVTDERAGLRRVRAGKGFRYL